VERGRHPRPRWACRTCGSGRTCRSGRSRRAAGTGWPARVVQSARRPRVLTKVRRRARKGHRRAPPHGGGRGAAVRDGRALHRQRRRHDQRHEDRTHVGEEDGRRRSSRQGQHVHVVDGRHLHAGRQHGAGRNDLHEFPAAGEWVDLRDDARRPRAGELVSRPRRVFGLAAADDRRVGVDRGRETQVDAVQKNAPWWVRLVRGQ